MQTLSYTTLDCDCDALVLWSLTYFLFLFMTHAFIYWICEASMSGVWCSKQISPDYSILQSDTVAAIIETSSQSPMDYRKQNTRNRDCCYIYLCIHIIKWHLSISWTYVHANVEFISRYIEVLGVYKYLILIVPETFKIKHFRRRRSAE